MILRDALALVVQVTEEILRIDLALLRRRRIPLRRLRVVLRYTLAEKVQATKRFLRLDQALAGGLRIPLDAFGEILHDAATVVIGLAKIEHRKRIALLGGLAEFLDGGLEVAIGPGLITLVRLGRRAGAKGQQRRKHQNPSHPDLLRYGFGFCCGMPDAGDPRIRFGPRL